MIAMPTPLRARAARLTAAALLAAALAAGCDDDPVRVKNVAGGPWAVVTTTDFATGALSAVSLDGSHRPYPNVASICSDAVVRSRGGLVYVVNRFTCDNIQILDARRGFAPVRQFSVGNGSDPHDIVVVGDHKAYVTRYNETDLWIVDPSTGGYTGSIDLGAFADADGIPEMDQMAMVGNRLFVTLQRVDRSTAGGGPTDASYLAVVDTDADTLLDADATTPGTQAITLGHKNPFSTLQVHPVTGDLYVACVGSWGGSDGGVDAADPATLAAAGTLLAGAAVQGDITDVEVVSADRGYAIFTDAAFSNVLVAFDPGTGAVTDTLYAPGAFVLQDVELSPTGELFLTDRTPTAPGLRVYDAMTGVAKTAVPIDVGLPPFSITFTD